MPPLPPRWTIQSVTALTMGTPTQMKTAPAPSSGALDVAGEEEENFITGKRRTTKATAAEEREGCGGGTSK